MPPRQVGENSMTGNSSTLPAHMTNLTAPNTPLFNTSPDSRTSGYSSSETPTRNALSTKSKSLSARQKLGRYFNTPGSTPLPSHQRKRLFLNPSSTRQQSSNRNNLIYRVISVQLILLLLVCLATLPYMLSLVHYSHILQENSMLPKHIRSLSRLKSTYQSTKNVTNVGAVPSSDTTRTPLRTVAQSQVDASRMPSQGEDYVASYTSKEAPSTKADLSIKTSPSALEFADDVSLVDLDLPLIQIVNTRFMQDQAELINLATARLALFETFCFPGMAGQTIQPNPRSKLSIEDPPSVDELKMYRFLWLFKVDPDLDQHSLNRLIDLFKPHPNFFLIGSNINYGVGVRPGSWRGGEAGAALFDSSISTLYTGSLPLLKYAHWARETKIVVETRLDADDGLPFQYLEAMGNTALMKLSPEPPVLSEDALTVWAINQPPEKQTAKHAKWLYWCATESINWYPTAMYKGLKEASVDSIIEQRDPGRYTIDAIGFGGQPICLTPGLSTGLAVGISYDDMPHIGHFELLRIIQRLDFGCGLNDVRECLHMVDMRPIRSRTPTSAGMKNLKLEGRGVSEDLVEKQWNYVHEVFGITKDKVYETNLLMQQNLVKILQDNFFGQCTTGHSCKKDTKETLIEMIRLVGGQAAVDQLPRKPLVYLKKEKLQQKYEVFKPPANTTKKHLETK